MSTVAQRRARAVERLEDTIAELFESAERYALTGQTITDMKWRRRELLKAAHQYAGALIRLSRVK